MNPTERIFTLLERLGVPYETLTHPPVTGCDDSVAYRRAAGWAGLSSKCILFHAKGRYYLVITTADAVLKARLFKREFGTKNIRFASPEEVEAETGCTVGSMPPFGVPDGVPVYVDGRIFEGGHFMFNPADPTRSVLIFTADLWRVYQAVGNEVSLFTMDEAGRLEFTPVVAP